MLEPAVRAQRAQERLLEEIVRPVAARPPAEEGEYLALVGLVEPLEGRDAAHHRVKRSRRSRCEMCRSRSSDTSSGSSSRGSTHTPEPGEIVHALETWEEPAGGGAVAAVQLANLGGSCLLFTALADDDLGRRSREELEARGVTVHAGHAPGTQRRALTHVDEAGERTITVLGDKLRPSGEDGSLPWEELRRCDAVYFIGGDVAALRAARRARVLVATARELATLRRAAVEVDVLVGSGEDAAERFESGELEPEPNDRRHDGRRARRLDPPRRAVPRRPAARTGLRRLRLRRLLRRGAHLRARGGEVGRRGRRTGRAMRSRRSHRPGCVRPPALGGRLVRRLALGARPGPR